MQTRTPFCILLTALFCSCAGPQEARTSGQAPAIGPEKGWLILQGGGKLTGDTEAMQRFRDLAGGAQGRLVLIPTAWMGDFSADRMVQWRTQASDISGMTNVAVLHTLDRRVADTEAFVAPLRSATAAWVMGGDEVHLAKAYSGTKTQRELEALLDRGGVIIGNSAGADILSKESTEPTNRWDGFDMLRDTLIVPHFSARHLEGVLTPLIAAHPDLLGLGIDEGTAIVVHGNEFKVIGDGRVAIYDGKDHAGRSYYYLSWGQKFDLKKRSIEWNSGKITR
jgi:cyanophycinase